MAFHPSLQEAVQPHTGGVLIFRAERLHDKNTEANIGSELSQVRRDFLEAGFSWGKQDISRHSSLLENVAWQTQAISSIILFEPHPSKFSWGEELQKNWSSNALTSLAFLAEQQIGRGIATIITWQPHSKVWEDYYRLVLDLQDSFVVRQIWEENSILAASYPSTEVQPLEQLYEFRKPAEVSHFLEANPSLTPLLREAFTHIRRYFLSSKLFLEVVADSEAIDEEQLVVFVSANHDPDEASGALNQLDEDWWLDAMEKVQDKLCITLEF